MNSLGSPTHPAKKRRRLNSSLFCRIPDGPLHPEDFSTGGFKVKLTKCPAVDDRCGCDIQVYGVSLANLKGRVVRVEENGTDPNTWSVGLSIDIPEDDRDRLSSLLMAFINGEEELVE